MKPAPLAAATYPAIDEAMKAEISATAGSVLIPVLAFLFLHMLPSNVG